MTKDKKELLAQIKNKFSDLSPKQLESKLQKLTKLGDREKLKTFLKLILTSLNKVIIVKKQSPVFLSLLFTNLLHLWYYEVKKIFLVFTKK